jgi:K(+)-stimulated pyrophosphate-energized sodium pump
LRPFGSLASSILVTLGALFAPSLAFADSEGAKPHHGGEAALKLPPLDSVEVLGMSGHDLLMLGLLVAAAGIAFGLFTLNQVKNLPTHKSMSDVSDIIWETCKTYLFQQGKFIAQLGVLIGAIIAIYYGFLQQLGWTKVAIILAFSVIGILGSYGVAWFTRAVAGNRSRWR